jgi:hypothetical protein
MKKGIAAVLCLLVAAMAFAGQERMPKSLSGVTTTKIVVDVNVENPDLLLKRMYLLDKTYRQLVNAGKKPVVVMAFRAKASLYITKGDAYVAPEQKQAKEEMKDWIEHFSKLGFSIEQCGLAADMLKIKATDFLPQVEVVENGYVSLIGYQHQGYAYLPMD